MNDVVDRLRAIDWTAWQGDSFTLLGVSFGHPLVLLLLLSLPLWSWWRRRHARTPATIPFSLTGMLAKGPRPRVAWVRVLPLLRSLALAAFIVAVGFVIGSIFTAKWVAKVPTPVLKRCFAILLVFYAGQLIAGTAPTRAGIFGWFFASIAAFFSGGELRARQAAPATPAKADDEDAT